MSGLALGGLASGMDTETIITQLMDVERQPRTRMALQDTREQARQTALRDLSTRLGAVRDAATALKSAATWVNTQTLTSSDAAKVAVSAPGSAAPGTHRIEVSQLAVTAQHAFTYAASTSAQSLTITPQDPAIDPFTLAVDPDADAATVAAAINADDEAPVKAMVAGGKLVLTSRTSGKAGDFTVDASPLLSAAPAYDRAGLDAKYSVDGVAQPDSPTNVVKDAILGVQLTFKATTTATGPVAVEVGDPGSSVEAVKAKVQAFVTAYNSAADYIRGKLAEKPIKDPTTTTEASKGLFYGDTMLSGALAAMRMQIGGLSDVGISTGAVSGTGTFSADAVAGRLQIDDTKLTEALAKDPDAMRTRLQSLGERLSAVVAPVAGDAVDERLHGVEATRKRLADAMAAADVRLANRETRLRAQFTAMETALAASQAAQSQLQAQLGAL
jgi:flagellar hook-associated protein 2